MIQVQCQCGKVLRVQDEHAGKKVRCPQCQTLNRVPEADGEAEATAITAPEPRRGPRRDADEDTAASRPRRTRDDRDDRDDDDDRSRRGRRDEDDDEDRPRRRAAAATSGKAIVSLVLGLLTCGLPVLPAIPGLIFGFLALGDIRRDPQRLKGKGLAIAGIIFSLVGNLPAVGVVLLICAGVFTPAVQQVQKQAQKAAVKAVEANNLKEIGLAMHNHHDALGALPPAAKLGPNGQPLLSWRVSILPYVQEDNLSRMFNQQAAWDAAPNAALLQQMPRAYQAAGHAPPMTPVQVCTGPNTPFNNNAKPPRMATFLDGTSNTIMVVQASSGGVEWSRPADLAIAAGQPLPPGLSGRFPVVMADGSVRTVDRARVNDDLMRKLIDPGDGNLLPNDW